MNLSGVQGIGPIASSSLGGQATTTSEHSAPEKRAAVPPIDPVTNQPLPPRFPWLSRLAMELEKSSPQPSPFGTPANLGNSVNKSA
jgi:hypothetical protein